ncbi:MAG TPA: hypothetical protein VMN77_01600 [Nitrospiria bacterium]|jgi:hypothetical protein|nr:hypothetical protein [Nitrospiria bacterium]
MQTGSVLKRRPEGRSPFKMARILPVPIGFFLVLFSVNLVSARSSASIIPFDQLAQPKQPVRMAVRLVTGGLGLVNRPVSGERIEFLLKDRSLGQTLSGGDGMAVKSFVPSKPGLYTVTVRLVENPRYEAGPVELSIACRNASTPILLVAVSSVRIPGEPSPAPFSPTPPSDAMPEAVKVLSRLSKPYQLLYVETGDEALITEAKDWLTHQGFPPAPLAAWPMPDDAERRMERFVERLQEVRDAGWRKISAGITRSVAEAEALIRLKIKAVLMAEEDEEDDRPAGAKKVTDWKAVPAAFQ